ncbi:hypothetical protein [Streptomyces sp. CS62]|uniref:hypothetical protein n=1 Tax=Streptomyces sp. CS62 TaxID=3119268 RepID=UPI002F94D388
MKRTSHTEQDMQELKATGRDTRAQVLERSIRSNVPLRKTFVQAPKGAASRHGPLKDFVTGRDLRGLKAYLMIVAACSNGDSGWSTRHDSAVWARLMDIQETATDQSARTGAWRTLRRLEERNLIKCSRAGTMITVTLLREDGTGKAYDRPTGKTEEDRFLQIPTTFWAKGYDEDLDLPALALLLVVAREKAWSPFPAEKAPEWYGWVRGHPRTRAEEAPRPRARGAHQGLQEGSARPRRRHRDLPLPADCDHQAPQAPEGRTDHHEAHDREEERRKPFPKQGVT